MDRAMHHHWLVAERRIDGALAGMSLCVLWLLALPITVLLTDLTWNSQFSMALMVSLPIATVFGGVLLSTLRVARAIEERDQEEISRWRATGTPPCEPELLRQRLHRDHHAMLAVVGLVNLYVVALAVVRMPHISHRAMTGCTLGILLIGLGMAGGAAALATPLRSRAKLWSLVLLGWTVPAGAVLCSIALIFGSNEIARAVRSPTVTSFVYVILGIIVLLAALSLTALWLAWFFRAVKGQGLFNHTHARVQFEQLQRDDRTAGMAPPKSAPPKSAPPESAPPQFDELDVKIVAQALRYPRRDALLALLVVATTGAILLLSLVGFAGTPLHGVVAAILSGSCLMYIYRAWKAL